MDSLKGTRWIRNPSRDPPKGTHPLFRGRALAQLYYFLQSRRKPSNSSGPKLSKPTENQTNKRTNTKPLKMKCITCCVFDRLRLSLWRLNVTLLIHATEIRRLNWALPLSNSHETIGATMRFVKPTAMAGNKIE